ncbi:MAG: acyl-CoA thioester hydrolase/BAAT C-terminal domain-containing protein [Gemmataceae bacterium]
MLISTSRVMLCVVVGVGLWAREPSVASQPDSVSIVVPQAPVLVDQRVRIRLRGLKPKQEVTLHFQESLNGGEWTSQAKFRANAKGIIDIATVPALSGTYKGVDAMGLFWSATKAKGQRSPYWIPWAKPKATWPVVFTARVDGKQVASATLLRRWVAPNVNVSWVKERGLYGRFFEPKAAKKRPAVLIFGGSGGGLTMQTRASLFAAHGYPTLAVAYFKAKGLPKQLSEIPLEYFEKAFRFLDAQPSVDGERLIVCGASRGGELALLLGSTYAKRIRGVVAYVPSSVLWRGYPDSTKSAWTLRGKPLPSMRSENLKNKDRYQKNMAKYSKDKTISTTPWWHAMLAEKELVRHAAIPVERTQGVVLLISGKKDATWPSTRMSEMVMKRLKSNKFEYQAMHLAYDQTGHMISPPYRPTRQYTRSWRGKTIGTSKGHARAFEDSWRKTLQLLEKHVPWEETPQSKNPPQH